MSRWQRGSLIGAALLVVFVLVCLGIRQTRIDHPAPPADLVYPGAALVSAEHPKSAQDEAVERFLESKNSPVPETKSAEQTPADVYSFQTSAAPQAVCGFFRDKITAAHGTMQYCDCASASPTLLAGSLTDAQGQTASVSVSASGGYVLRVPHS